MKHGFKQKLKVVFFWLGNLLPEMKTQISVGVMYSQIIENGQETTRTIQRTAVFNPLACYKCACLNAKLRTRDT